MTLEIIKLTRGRLESVGSTPPNLCDCPKPERSFPSTYLISGVVSDFRWETIVSFVEGSSWPWSYGSSIYNYPCNQWLSPLMLWGRISIRARCTTLCDKVCQWLTTSWWFSPGPPPTNKQTNIVLLLLVESFTVLTTLSLKVLCTIQWSKEKKHEKTRTLSLTIPNWSDQKDRPDNDQKEKKTNNGR
jgi:hypothetical protein